MALQKRNHFPSFFSCCHFLFYRCLQTCLYVSRYEASSGTLLRIDLFDFLIFLQRSRELPAVRAKTCSKNFTKLINHVNDSLGKIQRDTLREFIVLLCMDLRRRECENFQNY